MKQAVIFAGAPVQPEQQPPVPAADLYVCADAGVKLAQALGVVPDWIVGDFDSLGSVPEGENVEPFSPMKDDTDILLAAKYAFVDQYVAPLNVRASGYIKEVRFKEHQYVRQGDTLLVLDNREYQIKVKEAEAALLDAHGSQDVLHSGIETSHTNIAVQDANIAEAKAKLWQLEQDYHRFERLLKEESVPEQQYEQTKAADRKSVV